MSTIRKKSPNIRTWRTIRLRVEGREKARERARQMAAEDPAPPPAKPVQVERSRKPAGLAAARGQAGREHFE